MIQRRRRGRARLPAAPIEHEYVGRVLPAGIEAANGVQLAVGHGRCALFARLWQRRLVTLLERSRRTGGGLDRTRWRGRGGWLTRSRWAGGWLGRLAYA